MPEHPTATVEQPVEAEPTATLEDLASEIMTRREAACRRDAVVYPQRNPRASGISECNREMVYQITHWQRRPPPEPYLKQRFRRGHEIERMVIRELSEIGLEVIQSQMTAELRDADGTLLCTMTLDGRLPWHNLKPVFECKSLVSNMWQKFDSVADFLAGPSWARKYPAQILLYCYVTNEPYGLMLLDDCGGHWKVIVVKLADHLDYVESLLKRLREVVDSAAAYGKSENDVDLPPFHTNPQVCKDCWANKAGICFPTLEGAGGIAIVDSVEMVELIETMKETHKAHQAYAAADRRFGLAIKTFGEGSFVVGDVLVENTLKHRKAQAAKPAYDYLEKSIKWE